ncbi:TauD/TfdA family dioxygenase [Pelagibacterales bacterium SAG-MED47]|nr:TauD/TfdA family dioxygenase [Pelagibacterales bacterium SAG-MED47]
MKIELNNNKVFFNKDGLKKEIHPFWLRERVNGDNFVDKATQQRLFDPTELEQNIEIHKVNLLDGFLEVTFGDGVFAKLSTQDILKEFSKNNFVKFIERIEWDSTFKDFKIFEFKENFFEKKEMYDALINFYEYGFIIFKKVPTKNNFLINFANSIGSVRRTNFGEYFNVKSKPKPNDLAYTSLPLAPHTDNPYRNPVPCIQILHCIENGVKGGSSTLVDGFTVSEKLKREFPKYYKILSEVKVRFKFIDQSVVLEDWAEMIKLDEEGKFKQVRFSPRLDFVPFMEKKKLALYYSARKKISEFYNSDKQRIQFKLSPGDLLMMDNYRLLHGRTTYNPDEGNRFLQGCYIDYDSTEGKLKHLKRKFNL